MPLFLYLVMISLIRQKLHVLYPKPRRLLEHFLGKIDIFVLIVLTLRLLWTVTTVLVVRQFWIERQGGQPRNDMGGFANSDHSKDMTYQMQSNPNV